jgi:hypothetical protein
MIFVDPCCFRITGELFQAASRLNYVMCSTKHYSKVTFRYLLRCASGVGEGRGGAGTFPQSGGPRTLAPPIAEPEVERKEFFYGWKYTA